MHIEARIMLPLGQDPVGLPFKDEKGRRIGTVVADVGAPEVPLNELLRSNPGMQMRLVTIELTNPDTVSAMQCGRDVSIGRVVPEPI